MQKVTLDHIYNMPIGQIAELPACKLAQLINEASEVVQKATLLKSWLEGAMSLKYKGE